MTREKNLARRWTNRRLTGDANTPPPEAPEPVYPTAAIKLLSDYEDALAASHDHNLGLHVDPSVVDESRHLIEGVRLHAEVRRLRLEILDLIEAPE